MDYVELQFNVPILRALTKVVVERDGQRRVFPEPGSRDALCELIEASLTGVDIDGQRAMMLTFDSGHTVTIPLALDDRIGPEAATSCPTLTCQLQCGESAHEAANGHVVVQRKSTFKVG
jgi:hypothetical protein